MNIEMIQQLIYTLPPQEVKKTLASCKDSPTLHVYAFNYNWNNGFDLPQTIVDNPACALSTALLIFYLADGYRYLENKNCIADVPDWLAFISNLYTRIYNNNFADKSINFAVPLSKVQIYKLKKQLNEDEHVFITPIEGKDFNISI